MKTKTLFLFTLLTGLLILLPSGCNKKEKPPVLASISGKAGEVEIVSSKSVWESEAGNAVRTVLQAEYPFTPQKENKYRIYNVPPEGFVNVFRAHRNILYLHIADTCRMGEAWSVNRMPSRWSISCWIIRAAKPVNSSSTSSKSRFR